MKQIDLVYRTMFAELGQRSLDARFETQFNVEGRFVTVPVKGRDYWYFDIRQGDKVKRTYVGPHEDPEITRRVEAFQEIKDDFRARRKLVSTLTRDAGLPRPESFTGDVVEAMDKAGLFRLRGVLVGTVAFQCYSGFLGLRLPVASIMTGDADFAQFHSISAAVEDSVPPMLGTLRQLDETFREVPHQIEGRRSARYRNAKGYDVEFLTPNRGSADHDGQPAEMPALGGALAQPLRFLDYLIYQPVRSVLLHKAGIGVVIPAPERYAVHKLIVASRRRDDPAGHLKRSKDVMQAGLLAEAMIETSNMSDLAEAWTEAWERGPSWREAMKAGLNYMPKHLLGPTLQAIVEGLKQIGGDPAKYGFQPPEGQH